MKRTLFGLAALALMTGMALADDADILSVIPDTSLVAVVTKDADQAADHWFKLAVPLGAKAPEKDKSALDALFDKMTHGDEDQRIPACVDRKGPMAFVVVVPSLDVQGDPLAFIVKASDYKKFLDELAKQEGAAGPEVTPDGTDVIHGKTDSTYVAQLGKFVAISPAEYVIRNLKADQEKNLGVGKVAAIRRLMDTNDLAVYTNPDLAVKTFEPQINFIKTLMKKQMEQQAERRAEDGNGQDPKQMARFMTAYLDTLTDLVGQTDALCGGVRFSEKGATGTFVAQPVPETALARLAAAVKPAKGTPLATLDGPFVMAAAWDLRPELAAEVLKMVDDFVEKMELPAEEQDPVKEAIESYKKIMSCMAGPGGFVWTAAADGPVLHATQVMDVVRGKDLAAATREYMAGAGAKLGSMGSNMKVSVAYDPKVETHRGVSIDRGTVTFSAPEDKKDAVTERALKMIHAIYGETLVTYTARVGDTAVTDIGSKDASNIKAAIDRLLDAKSGSLLNSAAFAEAVAGLPEGRAAVFVMSFEDLMKTVGRMDLGVPGLSAAAKVKIDKPSAIGVSLSPCEKGVAVDFNVPMQEMQNLKKIINTMAGEEEGAEQNNGDANKNAVPDVPAK